VSGGKNPLKDLIADRVHEAVKDLESNLLPQAEGVNHVQVRRLGALRSEITVRRVADSPPRFFTVQVIEHE
jgi:hypothetical protein